MNFQEVKAIVIGEKWSGPKSGNEYRSLSKQIDNLIHRFEDENLPLQWLPLDIMTEMEVAQFVSVVLDRKGSRELFNNLKYKGLKSDLDDFVVSNNNEEEQKWMREEFPTLGNTKVHEVLSKIRCKLRIDYLEKNANFKQSIAYVMNYSDAIWSELERENGLANMIGLKVHNPDYLEAYADFVDGCISEILIFEILLNDRFNDKKQVLDFIWKHINRITDDAIIEYADKRKRVIKQLRDEKKIFIEGIEQFSEFFVSYLKRKSLYEEMDIMYKALQKEMKDFPELFVLTPNEPDDKSAYSDEEIKAYVLLGNHVSSYKQKINETYRLLDLAFASGNKWVSPNSMRDVRVTFRETFISKCPYNKRQAMRIARSILNNEKSNTEEHLLFYDLKMMRGYFCEWGIAEWYGYYIKIIQKVQEQLLLAYNTVDDYVAYRAVNRILYDFCDIIYYVEEGLKNNLLVPRSCITSMVSSKKRMVSNYERSKNYKNSLYSGRKIIYTKAQKR